MPRKITEQSIIKESRAVLNLLESGKAPEASSRIAAFNKQIAAESDDIDLDVTALWQQVEIASVNLSNQRYLEEVKDELNRLAYMWLRPVS